MKPERPYPGYTSAAHCQAGLVYVEYMLATLVLIVFLFMPIPGAEHSIVEIVMHSMRSFYQSTTYLMALP